jgi:osmotically-inducible protein OsmY
MKTLRLLALFTTVALLAGWQHSRGSDSTPKDEADKDGKLTATSGQTNSSVYSKDKNAEAATDAAGNKPADNTGKNARDRNDQSLTPGDQGNSDSDIDLTRRIRRAIVQKEGLSTNAKNIKIITVNGKTTLRGPVNSQEEKNTISTLAQGVAGGPVDNQLEVKTTNQ